MLKKTIMMNWSAITLTLLLHAALMTSPGGVDAQPKVVAIEGIGYRIDASLADNLKSLIGKKVSVTLNSGKTFTGFVKGVGNHLLHLEKLAEKDFFDALIRIDDISAIDTRFRRVER